MKLLASSVSDCTSKVLGNCLIVLCVLFGNIPFKVIIMYCMFVYFHFSYLILNSGFGIQNSVTDRQYARRNEPETADAIHQWRGNNLFGQNDISTYLLSCVFDIT